VLGVGGIVTDPKTRGGVDTVVLEVDEQHEASVHDPRRILWGAAMATLVWE
jgi:hypothetical protein